MKSIRNYLPLDDQMEQNYNNYEFTTKKLYFYSALGTFVLEKYGHAIKGFKIISPQKSFIMITFMNVFVSDRDTGTGALWPESQKFVQKS